MIKVYKVVNRECETCYDSSYNPQDCLECKNSISTKEVVLCMKCVYRNENVMNDEKLLCTKLHAWVEPCDFCAWGSKELEYE